MLSSICFNPTNYPPTQIHPSNPIQYYRLSPLHHGKVNSQTASPSERNQRHCETARRGEATQAHVEVGHESCEGQEDPPRGERSAKSAAEEAERVMRDRGEHLAYRRHLSSPNRLRTERCAVHLCSIQSGARHCWIYETPDKLRDDWYVL